MTEHTVRPHRCQRLRPLLVIGTHVGSMLESRAAVPPWAIDERSRRSLFIAGGSENPERTSRRSVDVAIAPTSIAPCSTASRLFDPASRGACGGLDPACARRGVASWATATGGSAGLGLQVQS